MLMDNKRDNKYDVEPHRDSITREQSATLPTRCTVNYTGRSSANFSHFTSGRQLPKSTWTMKCILRAAILSWPHETKRPRRSNQVTEKRHCEWKNSTPTIHPSINSSTHSVRWFVYRSFIHSSKKPSDHITTIHSNTSFYIILHHSISFGGRRVCLRCNCRRYHRIDAPTKVDKRYEESMQRVQDNKEPPYGCDVDNGGGESETPGESHHNSHLRWKRVTRVQNKILFSFVPQHR